jgi:hypothetical protein
MEGLVGSREGFKSIMEEEEEEEEEEEGEASPMAKADRP